MGWLRHRFAFPSLALCLALAGSGCSSPDPGEPAFHPGPVAWVGAWAAGQQLTEPHNLPPKPGLAGNTLRQFVLPTRSGDRVRLLLSNAWGDGPVAFAAVHLAAAGLASSIDVDTDTEVLFDGEPWLSLPAGERRFSDPVDFSLAARARLAITIHFGDVASDVTGHPGSRTTSYISRGNAVGEPSFERPARADHWYYVEAVDVEAPEGGAAVVILGDSITDGRGSTTNGNDRWPDHLARRLRQHGATREVAVINQGIGGNAVVAGGLGPTATRRFGRDVLEQRGVRWVIVLEGVNDIAWAEDPGVADRLVAAYELFIDRAHERGLLIYGVPILPFGGSDYASEPHETARRAVNEWIRHGGCFDAVLPLDEAVADPEDPTRLLPAFDTGDHLHLNPAGYQAMADAVDLSLLTP